MVGGRCKGCVFCCHWSILKTNAAGCNTTRHYRCPANLRSKVYAKWWVFFPCANSITEFGFFLTPGINLWFDNSSQTPVQPSSHFIDSSFSVRWIRINISSVRTLHFCSNFRLRISKSHNRAFSRVVWMDKTSSGTNSPEPQCHRLRWLKNNSPNKPNHYGHLGQ